MARIMRHRKLFTALTQANQTQDCTNFCDPYTTFLYFSPPPPSSPLPPTSPPPLPPSYSSAEAAATTTTYQTIQIPPYVIIMASLLAGLSLFGCYYFVVACRHGSFFHRFRNQPPRPSGDGEGGSVGGREEEEDDQRDLLDHRRDTPAVAVDHPIWYIATVGLHQAVINSITVCKYRAGEGLIEGTECSVCLAEFLHGETLRLLPKCSHAFHIPCIDRWLRSHTNCPLCRSPIVADAALPSAAAPTAGHHQSLASTNRSSFDSGPAGEMRVGSFGRNVGESVRISGVDGEAAVGVGDVRIDSKHIVGLDLDSPSRVGRSFSMDYRRYLRLNFNGFRGSSSDDHTVGLEKSTASSLGHPPPPPPETAASSGKRSLSCGDAAELFPRKSRTQYQTSSAIVLPL